MPLLTISTSASIHNKKELLEKSAQLVSSLTNKPKKFVMVKIEKSPDIYFCEDHSPSCYIEFKSIGSLEPSNFAKSISKFISLEMGIPIEKIYINFEDVKASLWGWNGKTFG